MTAKKIKKKYLLIEERENPSTEFYIEPKFKKENVVWERFLLSDQPPVLNDNEILSVLFVRYINPSWKHWVDKNQKRLGQVVFFIDDDVFDWRSYKVLPFRYCYKLFKLSFRHKKWLQEKTDLWVSSSWLAEKYADWKPEEINPASPYTQGEQIKTVFYHGSASHRDEIRWLYPVIKSVLEQDNRICFELIGDKEVRDMFSLLPRVHVTHPMKWPAYKAFVSRQGRTIGLAPLLDSTFNQSRSATKFFDITQAGAIGIYADHPVYRSMIQPGDNGMLVRMRQDLWIEAILHLANDEMQCDRMLRGARKTL